MMNLGTLLLSLTLCIFCGKAIGGQNSSEFSYEFLLSESKYECDFTGFLTQLLSMQKKHVSVLTEVYNNVRAKLDPKKPLSLYDAILEELSSNEDLKTVFIESNNLLSRCTKESANKRSGTEISTTLKVNNLRFISTADDTILDETENPIKHAYEQRMNPWEMIEVACEEANATTLMDEVNEHISDIENIRSDLEDELIEEMLNSASNLGDLIQERCYLNETLQQLTQKIDTKIQKCYGSFFGLQAQIMKSVEKVPTIETICKMLSTMVEYNIFEDRNENNIQPTAGKI